MTPQELLDAVVADHTDEACVVDVAAALLDLATQLAAERDAHQKTTDMARGLVGPSVSSESGVASLTALETCYDLLNRFGVYAPDSVQAEINRALKNVAPQAAGKVPASPVEVPVPAVAAPKDRMRLPQADKHSCVGSAVAGQAPAVAAPSETEITGREIEEALELLTMLSETRSTSVEPLAAFLELIDWPLNPTALSNAICGIDEQCKIAASRLREFELELAVARATIHGWLKANSPGGWIDTLRIRKDALEAGESLPSATTFRSMESAPRDGTPILGFVPSYYQGKGAWVVVLWMGEKGLRDAGWMDNRAFLTKPTHWMPLPPHPVQDRSTNDGR